MQQLKLLFWNTNKKKCLKELENIASYYEIDIFILVENPASSTEILLNLNKVNSNYFPQHPLSQCKKITVITKFHHDFAKPISEDTRTTIRKISIPLIPEFLLCGVHLVDKMNNFNESQSENCTIIRKELEEIEKKEDNSSSIIVGDFNMNPFESGVVNANGFHATMSRKVALKNARTINARTYNFFYNPMWNMLGDINKKVSGTYYYPRAEHLCYHWNMFDQVILRPSLIKHFDENNFSILDNDGTKSLLTKNGIPNKQLYSDHLPIFFTLNFK